MSSYRNTTTRRGKRRLLSRVGLCVLFVIAGVIVGYLLLRPETATKQTADQTGSTSEGQPAENSPQTVTDEALVTLVSQWADEQPANYSIVIEELETTDSQELRSASYNATTEMVPASAYKVYVAYAVLREIEQGTYTLATKAPMNGLTVSDNLSEMLINSDNDAARALGFMVGWQHINELLAEVGLTQTNMYNYASGSTDPVGDKHTTAADSALLLNGLYQGKLLSDEHRSLLFDLMEQQVWRERLAAGLPDGIRIVSKPGWLDNVQSDIGIIYGEKSTYLIAVYSTATSPTPLAELSSLVYDYLNPTTE